MQLHSLNTKDPICASHTVKIQRHWSCDHILAWRACESCTCEVQQPNSSSLQQPTLIVLYTVTKLSSLAFKKHQRLHKPALQLTLELYFCSRAHYVSVDHVSESILIQPIFLGDFIKYLFSFKNLQHIVFTILNLCSHV